MFNASRLHHVVAALALVAGCGAALALPAGRVLIAVGDVSAVRDGVSIRLAKDSPIESGDTVVTGATSNAQLRFTDGSIVALRPETQFRIESYNFRAADAGANENRGFFGLLKGGLRTVTGLIGKKDREAYSMKTPVATIGIRGTHYNLVLCQQNCRNNDGSLSRDGVYGSVLDGAIAMKNQAQERVFGKDEVFFVPDANTPPVKLLAPPSFLRDKLDGQARSRQSQQKSEQAQNGDGSEQQQTAEKAQSEAKAPETKSEPTKTEAVALPTNPIQLAQDDLTETVETVAESSTSSANGVAPSSGTMHSVHAVTIPNVDSSHEVLPDANILVGFDSTGATGLSMGTPACTGGYICRGTAADRDFGADAGVIAWGRWASGTITAGGWADGLTFSADQGMHYVVGMLATDMPTGGTSVYRAIGATSVTYSAPAGSNPLGVGTISNGTLTANFLTSAVTSSFDITFAEGSRYATSLSGTNVGPSISGSGTTSFVSGANNVCAGGCATDFVGFFAGSGATHAGIAFGARTSTNYYLDGAVVFKK